MQFELIKIAGFYITLAYNGSCQDVRDFMVQNDMPYQVESAKVRLFRGNNFYGSWCQAEYQVTLDANLDIRKEYGYLSQFVTKTYDKKPRMDILSNHWARTYCLKVLNPLESC